MAQTLPSSFLKTTRNSLLPTAGDALSSIQNAHFWPVSPGGDTIYGVSESYWYGSGLVATGASSTPEDWSPNFVMPSGVTGVWIDIQDLSTVFKDKEGNHPADGDTVYKVVGKHGDGSPAFALTQPTQSMRPIYKTNGTQAWLEFSGSQCLFAYVNRFGDSGLYAVGSEEYSVYAAVYAPSGSSGILISKGTPDACTFCMEANDSDVVLTSAGTSGSIYPGGVDTGGSGVAGVRWTGSVLKTSYNNTQTLPPPSVGTDPEDDVSGIMIGAVSDGLLEERFLTGDGSTNYKLYQLVILDAAITDQEDGWLRYYLGTRLGRTDIGVSYGSGSVVSFNSTDLSAALQSFTASSYSTNVFSKTLISVNALNPDIYTGTVASFSTGSMSLSMNSSTVYTGTYVGMPVGGVPLQMKDSSLYTGTYVGMPSYAVTLSQNAFVTASGYSSDMIVYDLSLVPLDTTLYSGTYVDVTPYTDALSVKDFDTNVGSFVDMSPAVLTVVGESCTVSTNYQVNMPVLDQAVTPRSFSTYQGTTISIPASTLTVTCPSFDAQSKSLVTLDTLSAGAGYRDLVVSSGSVNQFNVATISVSTEGSTEYTGGYVGMEIISVSAAPNDFNAVTHNTASFTISDITPDTYPFGVSGETIVDVDTLPIVISTEDFVSNSVTTIEMNAGAMTLVPADFSAVTRNTVSFDTSNAGGVYRVYTAFSTSDHEVLFTTLDTGIQCEAFDTYTGTFAITSPASIDITPLVFEATSDYGSGFNTVSLLTTNSFNTYISTHVTMTTYSSTLNMTPFDTESNYQVQMGLGVVPVAGKGPVVSSTSTNAFALADIGVTTHEVSQNMRVPFAKVSIPLLGVSYVVNSTSQNPTQLLPLSVNTSTFSATAYNTITFDTLPIPLTVLPFDRSFATSILMATKASSPLYRLFVVSGQNILSMDGMSLELSPLDAYVQERSLNQFLRLAASLTAQTLVVASNYQPVMATKPVTLTASPFSVRSNVDCVVEVDTVTLSVASPSFDAQSQVIVEFTKKDVVVTPKTFGSRQDTDSFVEFTNMYFREPTGHNFEALSNYEVSADTTSIPQQYRAFSTESRNSPAPKTLKLGIGYNPFGINGNFRVPYNDEGDQVISTEVAINVPITMPLVAKDQETGLHLSDFNVVVTRNNAIENVTLTLTEVGSGYYLLSTSFPSTGQISVFAQGKLLAYVQVVPRDKFSVLQDIQDEALGSWYMDKLTNKLTLLRQNGAQLAEFNLSESPNASSRERVV